MSNLKILMLDIIPPANHKHHCIRKGSFCPGHLLTGAVQHYMMHQLFLENTVGATDDYLPGRTPGL